jgi:hypothetical protein
MPLTRRPAGPQPRRALTVELEPHVALRLRPAAVARGTTVPEIAREILEIVAADKLIDAVLDDRSN